MQYKKGPELNITPPSPLFVTPERIIFLKSKFSHISVANRRLSRIHDKALSRSSLKRNVSIKGLPHINNFNVRSAFFCWPLNRRGKIHQLFKRLPTWFGKEKASWKRLKINTEASFHFLRWRCVKDVFPKFYTLRSDATSNLGELDFVSTVYLTFRTFA